MTIRMSHSSNSCTIFCLVFLIWFFMSCERVYLWISVDQEAGFSLGNFQWELLMFWIVFSSVDWLVGSNSFKLVISSTVLLQHCQVAYDQLHLLLSIHLKNIIIQEQMNYSGALDSVHSLQCYVRIFKFKCGVQPSYWL